MASGEEPGIFVVELANKEETNIKEVKRFHTRGISQAALNPVGVNNSALPIMGGTPFRGKRMIWSFISDATDIVESEETGGFISVLMVNQANRKVEYERAITFEDCTGFKPSGSIDITATAATKTRICYFDAPEGYLITLAPGTKYHTYIGDDA